MNVDALKTNLTELGTKIQTKGAELVQESKVKADALKEKAGEAIANAKKKKEGAAGETDAAALVSDSEGEGGGATTPTKRTSEMVRETIAGVAAKLKPPTVRVEDGSIADILLKAKAKVFRNSTVDGSAAAATTDETALVVASDHPSDFAKRFDDLASEMESTANDKDSPKEKVQKNLFVIYSKLKVAQDKFVAMVEAKKKQKAEAAAAESGEPPAPGGGKAAEAEAGAEATDAKGQKLKNLLSSAETAARTALQNAERVARETAKKTGLFDGDGKIGLKKADAGETLSGIAEAHAEPKPPSYEAATTMTTTTEPAAETKDPLPPPACAPPEPPSTDEEPEVTI